MNRIKLELTKKIFTGLLLCSLVLVSCGDYDKGYEDGCDGAEERWVIFGKDEYQEGYEDGWFDPIC